MHYRNGRCLYDSGFQTSPNRETNLACERPPRSGINFDRMPCLFLLVVLLFPRVALAILFFFSTYLDRPYHNNFLILLLGFLLLPLTTLAYAFMVNSGVPIAGINLLWLMLAVILDLGLVGGGYRQHRRG